MGALASGISILKGGFSIVSKFIGSFFNLIKSLHIIKNLTVAWNFLMSLNPITWIIVGVVALIALLGVVYYFFKDKINKAIKDCIDGLVNGIKEFWENVKTVFSWFWDKLKSTGKWVGKIFGMFGKHKGEAEALQKELEAEEKEDLKGEEETNKVLPLKTELKQAEIRNNNYSNSRSQINNNQSYKNDIDINVNDSRDLGKVVNIFKNMGQNNSKMTSMVNSSGIAYGGL